ncbi:MAG: PTS system mannose/fructose/sorbose family transporter subunit IID [Gemmatimonadota bacterium]
MAVGARLARRALPGPQPLGALGDRLIWAGWLPACIAIGLVLVALGARGWGVAAFLVLFNVVHAALRLWGLRAGWRAGLRVGSVLSHAVLQRGLEIVGPLAAVAFGAALPLVLAWVVRRGQPWPQVWDHFLTAAVGTVLFVVLLQRVHPRLSGLGLALVVMGTVLAGGVLWP